MSCFQVYVNEETKARDSLKWLRGEHFNVDQEIENIVKFQKNQQRKGIMALVEEKDNRRALTVSIGLALAFPMSGIMFITFYMGSIMKVSGVSLK